MSRKISGHTNLCAALKPTEVEWLHVQNIIFLAHISRQETVLRERIEYNSDLLVNYSNMSDLKDEWRPWWQDISVYNKNKELNDDHQLMEPNYLDAPD